jgi:hypothetical protein
MEEPEVPLEAVQEHLEHHAHHEKDNFVSAVALSTAIIAAFAAVASLLAGDHANEAMISQIQSSDQWAFFQAKSIKASVLSTKTSILEAQGQKLDPKDEEKVKQYAEDQKEIKEKAEELGREASDHLARHKLLASGVTLLQIAIAIGAISALTKKRPFWFLSLLFGLGGVSFLLRELFFFVAKPG